MRKPTQKIPKSIVRSYLQSMILFTKYVLGIGEKPRNEKAKNEYNKEKFPVWLPSYPPFYNMEADCFPVSENTENKQNLS